MSLGPFWSLGCTSKSGRPCYTAQTSPTDSECFFGEKDLLPFIHLFQKAPSYRSLFGVQLHIPKLTNRPKKEQVPRQMEGNCAGHGTLLTRSVQTPSRQNCEMANIGLVGSSSPFYIPTLKQIKFWNR